MLESIKPAEGFLKRTSITLIVLGAGYLALLFLKYQLGVSPKNVSGFFAILAVLLYTVAFVVSPKSLVVNFIDFVKYGSGSNNAQGKLMIIGFVILAISGFINGVVWALPGIF